MNVALFGGTFDPVHSGHLAAASAAMEAFALDQIHFVPASIPPHKRDRPLSAFEHRYAMVTLACAGVPQFIPSLLEAPSTSEGAPNFSIFTVHKMAAMLSGGDQLYFVIGADAFLEIGQWHQSDALLDSCNFIVASRPGFPIAEIERVIPGGLRTGPSTATSIGLRRSCVHLMNTVDADISSSAVRQLATEGKSLERFVPLAVAEYIKKLALFADEK